MAEMLLLSMLVGSTISTVGIIFYVSIKPLLGGDSFFVSKLPRFIYSVSFSVVTYIVSHFIFSSFDMNLGFSDTTPVGVASTIIIYVGTTLLTKNAEIV